MVGRDRGAREQPRIGLVIPAWNEAASVGAVLREVPPGTVDLVVVAAGDSTDATAEIARRHGAAVVGQERPGYGAACLAGARAAAAAGMSVIAFLDGDYSDPPAALPHVLAPLLAGSADLALGCRDVTAHPGALPAHARLGNGLVLAALQMLLGRRLHDLPSFKAISVDAFDRLAMREMSYGWTVEMVTKALRAPLRVVEVPVPYRHRLGGRSKVSGTVRGTLGAALALCACALRYAAWAPRGGASPAGDAS